MGNNYRHSFHLTKILKAGHNWFPTSDIGYIFYSWAYLTAVSGPYLMYGQHYLTQVSIDVCTVPNLPDI